MPIFLEPTDPPDDVAPDDPVGLLNEQPEKPSKDLQEARVLGRAGQAIRNIIGAFEWDDKLHPRNRLGRFIETPDQPKGMATPPDTRIEFTTTAKGKYSNASGEITASVGGRKLAGLLRWSLNDDMPMSFMVRGADPKDQTGSVRFVHIDMIQVDPDLRRQGIATALLTELRTRFPRSEGWLIDTGSLTPEGAALIGANDAADILGPQDLDSMTGMASPDKPPLSETRAALNDWEGAFQLGGDDKFLETVVGSYMRGAGTPIQGQAWEVDGFETGEQMIDGTRAYEALLGAARPLPFPVTVYRGNPIFTPDGFVSTTLDPDVAQDFAAVHGASVTTHVIPAGTYALWLGGLMEEDELLLMPPNADLGDAHRRGMEGLVSRPDTSDGMASPPGGWTATDETVHPVYPKGFTGRAGKHIRIGDRLMFDGHEWEVTHILQGRVVMEEASGDPKKVEIRIINPADTPGEPLELGGASLAKAKKIVGGKDSDSNVRIVSPYVEPSTHDPSLALPASSKLTADQWKRFGRVEQMHYIDLMERYGTWKTGAPIKTMVSDILKDFDQEIIDYVKSAHQGQYGASTGGTLSVAKLSGSKPKMEKRERAMELQGRLRDVIAWDLYNRTRSPDVTLFHGSSDSVSWWKKLVKSRQVFSGMSQSFNIDAASNFGSNIFATPTSIRHIVLATTVTNWTHTNYVSEREIAIVPQFQADLKRSLVFQHHEIGAMARKWLMNETKRPRPGEFLDTLRDHLENDTILPVTVDADIAIASADVKPPPPNAIAAMEDYGSELPEIKSEPYTPAQLKKKKLPWQDLDEKGNPQPLVAAEAGVKPGDFMVGLKGTLYWIGPDKGTKFGLRYHKIDQDSKGKLYFTGESWNFEDDGANQYYFLQGNVPPLKDTKNTFDPQAWQLAAEDPLPIAKMAVGEKFKVDGVPYEKIGEGNAKTTTPIKDLESGKQGTINSAFAAVRIVPSAGYKAETVLQPAKGLTFAYEGKKHTITSVKKDGIVSAKPSGGKVVQIAPDDPSLQSLFNPAQWEIGTQTAVGNLGVGQRFHGGTGKKTIRPYEVTAVGGGTTKWINLDTGQKGEIPNTKKVSILVDVQAKNAGAVETKPEPPEPNVGPPKEWQPQTKTWADLKPGEQVTNLSGTETSAGKELQITEPATVKAVYDTGNDKVVVSFEDKNLGAVVAKKDAPAPLSTEPEVQATDVDALPEADIAPYKSKYGSGGKYTHDKIQEMPVGTVFQDKNGKAWKVQSNESQAVITDGQANYQVNGDLRGKVVNKEVPNAPAAPIVANPYEEPKKPEVKGPIEMKLNDKNTALKDLPENTIVTLPGEMEDGDLYLTTPASGDTIQLIGVSPNAKPKQVSASQVPAQIALPESGPGPKMLPPNQIEPDMTTTTKQLQDLTDPKEQAEKMDRVYYKWNGQMYAFDGSAHFGRFIVMSDGSTQKLADEKFASLWHPLTTVPDAVLTMPSSKPQPKPPTPEPSGDPVLQNLNEGDEFEIDGKPYELIAVGNDAYVKNTVTSAVVQVPKDASSQAIQDAENKIEVPATAVNDTPEYQPTASLASLNQLTDAEIADLPQLDLAYYKSAYGSGGKYKHERLGDLLPGDKFRPKGEKSDYVLVKSITGGTVLIYKPADGSYGLAKADGRVRKS